MTKQRQTMEEQKNALKRYEYRYPVTARLEHYSNEAKKYRETTPKSPVRIHTNNEGGTVESTTADTVSLLESYIQLSKEALDKNDIDNFAQSFEWVVRYAAALSIPAFIGKVENRKQRERNKARIQKYDKLRLRVIKRYESGDWSNPRRASRDIATEFGEPDRHKTFYRWLLANRKKQA